MQDIARYILSSLARIYACSDFEIILSLSFAALERLLSHALLPSLYLSLSNLARPSSSHARAPSRRAPPLPTPLDRRSLQSTLSRRAQWSEVFRRFRIVARSCIFISIRDTRPACDKETRFSALKIRVRNDRDETNDDDDGSAGVMIWHRVPRECIALDPAKKRESAVTSVARSIVIVHHCWLWLFSSAPPLSLHRIILLRITALPRIHGYAGSSGSSSSDRTESPDMDFVILKVGDFSRKRIPRTAPIS